MKSQRLPLKVYYIMLSQIKKCLNANNDRPADDRLTTVQFHPSAQVVMTAGLDHSISLFQVKVFGSYYGLALVPVDVWHD